MSWWWWWCKVCRIISEVMFQLPLNCLLPAIRCEKHLAHHDGKSTHCQVLPRPHRPGGRHQPVQHTGGLLFFPLFDFVLKVLVNHLLSFCSLFSGSAQHQPLSLVCCHWQESEDPLLRHEGFCQSEDALHTSCRRVVCLSPYYTFCTAFHYCIPIVFTCVPNRCVTSGMPLVAASHPTPTPSWCCSSSSRETHQWYLCFKRYRVGTVAAQFSLILMLYFPTASCSGCKDLFGHVVICYLKHNRQDWAQLPWQYSPVRSKQAL